jgi:hypothetical protein
MTRDSEQRFTMWPAAVAMRGADEEVREVFGQDASISHPKESHEVLASLDLAWMTAVSRIARHDRGREFAADPSLVVVVDATQLRSAEASNLAARIATRAVGTRVILAIAGDIAKLPLALKANIEPLPAPEDLKWR